MKESFLKISMYEKLFIKIFFIVEENWFNFIVQDFLRFLNELRTIIFQNSIFLRREFLHHSMWKDFFFVRENYFHFFIKIKIFLIDVTKSNEFRIQRIVSNIINRFNINRANIVRNVNEHNARNHRLLKSNHKRLKDFFADKIFVTFYVFETSLSFSSRTRTMNAKIVNLFVFVTKDQNFQLFTQFTYEAIFNDEDFKNACTLNSNVSFFIYIINRTINIVSNFWQKWMFKLNFALIIQTLKTAYEIK